MKYFFICFFSALFITASPFTHTGMAENFRVMLHAGSFPPYFFEKGDSRTGIVEDLYSVLFKETGDTIEYVRVPFKRALFKFDSGQIDIEPMANPAWRESSTVEALYSIPFAVSEEILLFNTSHSIKVNSPDDLIGKTIGVVKGYAYPVYDPYFSDGLIRTHELQNENKLIQLLVAGRLDQALMNKDFALYQMKAQKLKDKLVVSDFSNGVDIMMRFHPSKKSALPRFNKALQKLLDNGTIKQIYDKYR